MDQDVQRFRDSVTNGRSTGPTGQPSNEDLSKAATYRFSPFDEHLSGLIDIPRWQQDLEDHFTIIFEKDVLSKLLTDDMVESTLQIIGRPTQAKMRGLALAVHTHWMCVQFRRGNMNESAPEIVALISRITDHLDCMSVHAKKDFLDELNYLCIEKLKLSWRWYVDAVVRHILTMPREHLYTKVIAVVAMIGHLFRGGQLHDTAAFNALRFVAAMSPWTDAAFVTYTLLRQLGPNFTMLQSGWEFIQKYLADLSPFTEGRAHDHPLCQLLFAIKALLNEWRDKLTPAMLYPRKNNQSVAQYHS